MEAKELLKVFQDRRSVRQYTEERVDDETLKNVLRAGLMAASGKSQYPWEFLVIRDKEKLAKMSGCRVGAAKMLEKADAAILVLGDAEKSDVWEEDCAVAMANMHLMADASGLGSCWIQARAREASDGTLTNAFLRQILHYPEKYQAAAILSIGVPKVKPRSRTDADLKWDKVHFEEF